ncbi:MAG: Slp family lipoprotein [Acidiferrobacteraceae bacterium]
MKRVLLIALPLILAGCATLPRSLRSPGVTPFTVRQALLGQVPLGAKVRWGGTIASIRNGRTRTWVEIVEQPLDGDGWPQRTDRSQGRFLARFQGFLDPAIYTAGRRITVVGNVGHRETRTIGAYSYRFPVVKVTSFHLWRPLPRHRYVASPNPFWVSPWYPWGYPFY